MDNSAIVQAIDFQISQLQQARALLTDAEQAEKKRPGRPKKISPAAKTISATPKKRTMSAEGKARIAAAQKLRWAKQNRAK